ncbi:TrmB family transcriptional regulator [Candidatus Woesearchaeota archaeon]|nr:TrmB family transcriptional regulator [Candidatus Woesearchaeota archaeon]
MIVSDAVIKKIRSSFDLNIYEAKEWLALLSKGIATAGELSEISSVPRSRSYDVLESLEKRGFVIMKLGRPIRYIAVKPSDILERIKKDIKIQADSEIKSLGEIEQSDSFKELNLLFNNGIENINPSDIMGVLKGRTNIYSHLNSLFAKAKKEIIIVTSQKALNRKLDKFSFILKNLKNKGVYIRIAAPFNDKNLAKEYSLFAKIKDIDMKARFFIIDNKDLLFLTTNEDDIHEKSEIALWINSEFFVNSLKELFETSWKGK